MAIVLNRLEHECNYICNDMDIPDVTNKNLLSIKSYVLLENYSHISKIYQRLLLYVTTEIIFI